MLQKYRLIFICSFFLLLCLLAIYLTPLKSLNSLQKNQSDISSREVEQLKKYALTKINEDRKNFGLTLVLQSNNTAAQAHANELLKTEFISHWTTDGFKPYMYYSLHNGTGYVQQNIGQISYIDTNNTQNRLNSSDFCNSYKKYYCPSINPYDAITTLEHSMIYNDTLCCNDGHKNNILDRFHTHVSLGISFNNYYFVMVQNFENQYLNLNHSIQKNYEKINLEAKIFKQDKINFRIDHVSFFLDDLPNKTEYENNKNKNHYELGDLKLIVSEPLPSHKKYIQPDSLKIIEAKKWDLDKHYLNLEFTLPDTINVKNKVLTMVIYGENIDNKDDTNRKDSNNTKEFVPLTSYTFF